MSVQMGQVAQSQEQLVEVRFSALIKKLEDAEALHASLEQMIATAQEKLTEITSAANAALIAKVQITDEQAIIATKSRHIRSVQEDADKVGVELKRLQTVATQHATEAEGLSTRAQTATDNAVQILAEIQSHRASAATVAGSTSTLHDESKSAADATKKLADKSETVEKRIADYEGRLSELETQSKAQLETITGLLPGATAAGLAHSFDQRRQTFLDPSNHWQWLFISAILSIVGLAGHGLWQVSQAGTKLDWDDLARLWVARLPIAGALIWLALHASRESALAKRLEEDYGYKAAIAASFQGFHKQMADIGKTASEGSPLAKLCGDTLATIASPPGRIYDKHRLTVTPTGELAETAAKIAFLDKSKL